MSSDTSPGPRVAIAGASGKLGRRTAELLLERHGAQEPILVTRTPDAVADLARAGAVVRRGDYDEPESLREAFAGAERLLLISASDLEVRVRQHRAAIDAARQAGVRHVVYTSALRPEPPNPAAIAPSHHATELALAESGMDRTILRNSLYSEYQAPEASAAIAGGVLTHNRGDGRIAYVSREDCAAVCAVVLSSPGHEGAVYDVTGPEAFDAAGLARLYGELGGRTIETEALDDETFAERIGAAAGDDDHARYGALLVTSLGRAVREGYMAACSDVVERLTSRPARTLREVLAADESLR
ncbi:MAG TPA: SDR family oxidoreductase [Solirubrobacteraceae bacterium]|jgi:NAD(P)H dehydrogenase (quinone)|nr:SDR family oxidoreductase [Solirubrobacteraceae bacterium]